MKPEKIKSQSEAKLRCSFPKNVKFYFCSGFWAILRFYQQFHCKIYVLIMDWWGPNLIFFLVISITLSCQIKKIEIPKILPMSIFVAPKCRQNVKILQLVWILTTNILNKMSQLPDFRPSNSIPSIMYGNKLFDIYLIASKA